MDIKKELTKNEIRNLLILTYLGEWMMTSHYSDKSRSEYTDVLDKMLKIAHRAGLDEYVSWQDTERRIEPSPLLESKCQELIDEYGDKFFLDELSERLSRVDVESLVRYQKDNL